MDRYTKTILTVIATCLVIIAFRDVSVVSEVSADDPTGGLCVTTTEGNH